LSSCSSALKGCQLPSNDCFNYIMCKNPCLCPAWKNRICGD